MSSPSRNDAGDGDRPGLQISIVLPVFNEESNLPRCLETLSATFSGLPYEVVIVDDGSRDGTLSVARRWEGEHPGPIQVLAHERNQGIGGAIRTGIGAARGEYVMTCAADLLFEPEDWAPYAGALGRADVLVGHRLQRVGYNPLMRFNSWLYPHLVATLFGLRLRDVNWICVYRRDLLRGVEITQRGIPMLVEILVKLRDRGASFLEVDCRMQARAVGKPTAGRFKVMWRTLTGLLGFWREYRRQPRPAGVEARPVPVPSVAEHPTPGVRS
jgi:glycosyltransferase involved in cell wall biosynthesis